MPDVAPLNAPGIRSIRDRFLSPGNLFGLQFNDGIIFGHVLRREALKYKPLRVTDEAGTVLTVAPQAASDEIVIKDPRTSAKTVLGGTDLKPKWGRMPQILHGSVGVYPNNFQMYVRYPTKAGNLHGVWPTTNAADPGAGDELGNVDGDDSPYHDPTDALELVLVPGADPSFRFFNTRSSATADERADSEQPVLNCQFARYGFEFLNPLVRGDSMPSSAVGKAMKKRANVLIRKIMFGEFEDRFRWLPVGAGESLIEMPGDLKSRWREEGDRTELRPITMDEALTLQELT